MRANTTASPALVRAFVTSPVWTMVLMWCLVIAQLSLSLAAAQSLTSQGRDPTSDSTSTSTRGASVGGGVHEYCEWETFNVTCARDEVLVVRRARYGRMAVGRCVERNYGNMGCSTDVTADVDAQCSGRRRCEIDVISLHRKRSCPPDLKSYLEVDFTCTKVALPASESCPPEGYIEPAADTHQLASSATITTTTTSVGSSSSGRSGSDLGSHACPWRITVQPYQTINITIIDFSVPPLDGLWYSLQPRRIDGDTCTAVVGHVTESGGSNVSLCAGMRREAVAYQSRSSTVFVAFAPRRRTTTPVIVKYAAVGCAPVEAPANAHVRSTDNMAVVECNETREAWYLTCKGTEWVGSFSNCSKPGSYMNGNVDGWSGDNSLGSVDNFPVGVLLVVALGVALGVAVGVLMLVAALLYLKRRKHSRIRSQSSYILHAIDDNKYSTVAGAAAANGLLHDATSGSGVYADRCTLLVRREPFRCHTISRDCNMTLECAQQQQRKQGQGRWGLQRSRSTHSAGNIVDGVIITALPSASSTLAHASTTPAILDVGNNNKQQTTILQNRDKSLDYRWDSCSVHDCDEHSSIDGLTDVDALTQCRPSNIAQSSTTLDSSHVQSAPFCSGVDDVRCQLQQQQQQRGDEPYYFKYDPKRPRVQFSDDAPTAAAAASAGGGDERKPDVVSNCSSFRVVTSGDS